MRMDMRSVARMTVVAVILSVAASTTYAAESALPWSFVKGSAKEYSIQLVSASPVPGAKVTVGQTVEFKVAVSYQLSIANKGLIVVVLEDANNQTLSVGKAQQNHVVSRGKGMLTITESFVVPTGPKEVRLFISLVAKGIAPTDGELVLRYPVSYEAKSTAIGYPSVAAALADLHSKPELKFHEDHGWIIAEDSRHYTYWSFPPAGDPAYPSAVRRVAVKEGTEISMHTDVLCESTQSACDKLVKDFNKLDERVRDSIK
jgi:hypothetical protein